MHQSQVFVIGVLALMSLVGGGGGGQEGEQLMFIALLGGDVPRL